MRRGTAEHPYLLIPGPTEVHPDVVAAGTAPMIGHRGAAIHDLLAPMQPRLQSMLGTRHPVLPLTCSASGAMEASVRNAGSARFLHLVTGAFGARWSKIRAACGAEGDGLEFEWGEPASASALRDALGRRAYGAVTIVHSETSTGVLNPLAELTAEIRRTQPDALILVDTVTSMAAVPLELDAWGVDVCFAGTQKAWGLPPGLTLCSVSARALERSESAAAKGFYFDFVECVAALERFETPSTPALSLLFQLEAMLERIEREGLDVRYARHRDLAARVEAWAVGRFEMLPCSGFRSPSLSVLAMDDPSSLIDGMRARGWWLASGYGTTRDSHVRIGHMGEMTPEVLDRALEDVDTVLRER